MPVMPPFPLRPVLTLFVLLVLLCPPLAAQEGRLALVGGTLIDGTGAAPMRDSVVLIEGERIVQVGTRARLPVPDGFEVISTEGMTVLPGLIDPHVHLLYNGHPDSRHWFAAYADRFGDDSIPASAYQALMAGVTTVRDLAGPSVDILRARRRIAAGELPGATIHASGAALAPAALANRPDLLGVGDAGEAAATTRSLMAAGVDLILFTGAAAADPAVLDAVVETAHAGGLRVATHGRADEDIRAGLRAGVDEFHYIGTASPQYPPDILEAIGTRVETGAPLYWSPVLGAELNADELAADPEFLDDPRNFLGVPDDIERDVRQALAAAEFRGRPQEVVDTVRRKVQQLNELGVIFVSGSGMGSFGHPAAEATWRDLEAWVFEIGMAPLTAIKWATLDAAAYLGVDGETGSVTPGKLADVIAVRGSPLRHFSVLREPALVIKGGVRYK